MRIKLSANSPLPPFKAWYPIHIQGSISSLKNTLCSSLSAFHGLHPSSLQLSIDGFELLDGSDLSVLRDGDLVYVDLIDATFGDTLSAIATPSVRGTHAVRHFVFQNASHKDPGPSTSHKRKRRASTPTSSSSSESETESTSASSSSTSSASGSDDETDSDSDSESESEPESSPPPIETLRKTALATQSEREPRQVNLPQQPKPQAVHPETFVPPGYGKLQTRARNLRRRRKRLHEREVSAAPSISGPLSGANAVVSRSDIIPSRETSTPTVPDAGWDANSALDLPSLSLRNKNKAKNFRSFIGKPLPPKIIFGDEEAGVSASTSGSIGTPDPSKSATPTTTDQPTVTQSLPRLIPPSSRSSLPTNLFVTSIDVEAGLRRNKKKRRMRVEYGNGFDEDHVEGLTERDGDVLLDYGNADTDTMDIVPSESQECEMDLDALESKANKQWGALEKLTDKQQVVPGCIVGYKALGISLVTYTPEYLLTLVDVVRLDGELMAVRPRRPSREISFGGPVGENEEGVDEEEHSWNDIANGDWRIVWRV